MACARIVVFLRVCCVCGVWSSVSLLPCSRLHVLRRIHRSPFGYLLPFHPWQVSSSALGRSGCRSGYRSTSMYLLLQHVQGHQPFHTLYTLTSYCEIFRVFQLGHRHSNTWVKFDAILQFINPLSLIWTSHSVISSPTQYKFSCCAWANQASLSDVWILEEFSRFEKNFTLPFLSPYVGRLPCRIGHSSPYCRDHSYLSLHHWDEYLWCIHIIIIFKLNLTPLFQLYSVQMAMVHTDLLCLLYFYLKLAYLLELLGAFLVCGDFNISIDCGIQHSRWFWDDLSPTSSHIHRWSLCQP